MIAKLASDTDKPRALMEVRAGWEEGCRAGLPLKALPGIGPKTTARLAELGLVDAVQVQQMTREALEELIGPDAKVLKLRAHGYGGTALHAERLPRSVSRDTTLALDAPDPSRLTTRLSQLPSC